MAKTIKVRTRPGAKITEQPAEPAKLLIKEGLWYAGSDEKAAEPRAEPQAERVAPQRTRRKSR